MARDFSAKSSLFCFILLSLHTVCSLGISVGFLYDARKGSESHWSPQETLSFLESNKVLPNQFKILITGNSKANLGSLINTSVAADLHVSELELQKLLEVKSEAYSSFESHAKSKLPGLSISSITVSSNELNVSSLLPTLKSVSRALKSLKLSQRIKLSALLRLSTIETLDETQLKLITKVASFLRKTGASLTIEFVVDGQLSMGDTFAHSILERALSACASIPSRKVPLKLLVKSCVVPSGVEMGNFTARITKLMNSHTLLRNRISEVFVDISHLNIDQKKLAWEREMIFPSSRRELSTKSKIMVRDGTYIPITNPATTPVTIPSTNPTMSPVVTIPSTTPATVYPTNPAMTPGTYPYQTPVPATDPYSTPFVPITNPATTPSTTIPVTPPVGNPITTYPVTPTVGTPYVPAPVTVPSTTPFTPAVSGQTWCVAKTGVPDQYLQSGLDYACGIGNVDCSPLQPTGSCYNPNTLQAHASYAYNSYYQRNPVATSCDFGGTAMLVNVNPSTSTCIFASSSSTSYSTPATTYNPVPTYSPGTTYNPATGGIGSTTGTTPSVYNSNNPGGSNPVYGSYTPTGSGAGFDLPATWVFYHVIVMIIYLSCRT